MAWDLTIAATSQKAKVDQKAKCQITMVPNERSTFKFRATWDQNYAPARFAEVFAYAQNGTTAIFGGVVLDRARVNAGPTNFYTDVTCTDWWFYLDHSYVEVTFAAPVTIKAILVAIVGQLHASLGITVDAAQATGPTVAAYSFSGTATAAVKDALKRAPNWMALMSPLKALKGFAPSGGGAAPFAITDAAPRCTAITLRDSKRPPKNSVRLTCGPTGTGDTSIVHSWTANGVATTFSLETLNVPASAVWPGVVVVAGVSKPLWPAGAGGANDIEWDPATAHGRLTFKGTSSSLIPNTTVVTLTYYPQFPFVVTRASGATPVLTEARADTSVTEYARAVERAVALLAEVNQQPDEIDVVSNDVGWLPGQALTVNMTYPLINAIFGIGSVRVTMKTDDSWEYAFDAAVTDKFQGSTLDLLREKIHAVATGGAIVSVGPVAGGSSGTSLYALNAYLGGSGNSPTTLSDSVWKNISGAVPLPPQPADFSGLVQVDVWTRNAGIALQLRLWNVTNSTVTGTSSVATPGADPDNPLVMSIACVVPAGKKHVVQIIGNGTAGNGEDANAVATICSL